ncbi:MAG TPA: YetF domain-containing protein [Chitinophagaceae bacterium]|jgi:uncharacterized membrane protein YcaP (DUF421 family)
MNIHDLWGSGSDLTTLQMSVRSFVMFFVALILIRIGGMRIFGKRTAFDNILAIMLGAILARGITGASPFFSAVAAAGVMVIVHKILALLAIRYIVIGKIVKGIHRSLYENGEWNLKNMKVTGISRDDVMEGVRMHINSDSLDDVKEATIEKNGQVSIVRK